MALPGPNPEKYTIQGPVVIPVAIISGDNSEVQGTAANPLVTEESRGVLSDPLYAVLNDLTNVDAFGRLVVAQPQSLFDSKMIADNQPLIWDDAQTSGAGTSSTYNTNQSSVTLAVSNLTAGKRVRQTFQRFPYQPGKAQVDVMTGILGAPRTGITTEIGPIDDRNGLCFSSRPDGIYVIERSFVTGVAVDNAVRQDAWNIDKLDGNGPSGIVANAAFWNASHIFFTTFQWLGAGSEWFAVEYRGRRHFLHRFDHAGITNKVAFSNPNLPLRYSIANDGTGAAASMLQICSTVLSSGGSEETGIGRTAYRDSRLLINADATWFPLLGIRLKAGYEHARINIKKAAVSFGGAGAQCEWKLVLNPTIVGTALTWNAVANSAAEVMNSATNATSITGGTDMDSDSQIIVNGAPSVASAIPLTDLRLGTAIDGTRDFVILAVRRLTGGNTDAIGAMTWRSQQ